MASPGTNTDQSEPQIRALWFGGEEIAWGEFLDDHPKMKVHKGSRARTTETPSTPEGIINRRKALISEGTLVLKDGDYELTEDVEFPAPSTAASVFLGRNARGPREWLPSEKNPPRSDEMDSYRGAPVPDHPKEKGKVLLTLKQGGLQVAYGVVDATDQSANTWDSTSHSGRITVLAGSDIRVRANDSLSTQYKKRRDELIGSTSGERKVREREVGPEKEPRRRLVENEEFSSLSTAASVIMGAQVNGRDHWTQATNTSEVKTTEFDVDSGTAASASGTQLNGLSLHIGFTDGSSIYEGISPSESVLAGKEWKAGAMPVSWAENSNSELVSRDKENPRIVGRSSALVKDALIPLGLDADRAEDTNRTSRWHLNLSDSGYSLNPHDDSSQANVIGIEAIFDGHFDPNKNKSKTVETSASKAAVLVLHLESDEDVINGTLSETLGRWLYGVSAQDFQGYLNTLLMKTLRVDVSAAEKLTQSDPQYVATFQRALIQPGEDDHVSHHQLLDLAALRGNPGDDPTPQEEMSERDQQEVESRLVNWAGRGGALFTRTGMFVFRQTSNRDNDISDTVAMETSSVYVDAVALAMLEYLTLKSFLQETRAVSQNLVHKSEEDFESIHDRASALRELQSKYMLNSVSYGKLYITMSANTGDIYRALRKRWRTEQLRADISSEITRLTEHVSTLAEQDSVELDKSEHKEKEREREERQKRIIDQDKRDREADRTTVIIMGSLAALVGAPTIATFADSRPSPWAIVTCAVLVLAIIVASFFLYNKTVGHKDNISDDKII